MPRLASVEERGVMQHPTCNGEVAIDTSKFDSWPLLRPDELTGLPTEVLRASVADLDTMCRHASGDDPVAGYARIQRERSSAILSERAAQARVQALLTGAAFVGREHLETAPSHDNACAHHHPGCSNHPGDFGQSRHELRTLTAAGEPVPSCNGCGAIKEQEAQDVSAQDDVRSPPRLQPSTFGSPAVVIVAAVDDSDSRRSTASSLINEPAQYPEGDGGQTKEHSRVEHGRGTPDRWTCEGQPAVPTSLSGEEESGTCGRESGGAAPRTTQAVAARGAAGGAETARSRPREPSAFHGVPSKTSNRGVPPPSGTAGAQHQPHNPRGGGGRTSHDSAVRDNWGSVFVVGGGRRRRRPLVKQRPAEAEDTPAARRAQVEKERLERRKASLRRLMARKEQRALQQEARRKRKAAAPRKAAAATAPAPAPDSGAEPAPATAGKRARGAREGAGGPEGEERESLVGSRRRRSDGIVAASETAHGPPEPTAAQHKHRSSAAAANDDSEAGNTVASSAPPGTDRCLPTTAVNGATNIDKTGGHRNENAVSLMNSKMPGQGGGGASSSCSGSSGSESESVSGGDSSDDDDLFLEEIDEDGGPTPKDCVSSDSNSAATTDQAKAGRRKDTVAQPEARWASGVADGAAREGDAACDSPRRRRSGPELKAVETAEDDDDRAEDSLEQQQQRHPQTSAAELLESDVSPGVSSTDLRVGLSGAAGGDGSVDAAVGEGNTVATGAVVQGAVDAVPGGVDANAVAESDDSDSESELEWEGEADDVTKKNDTRRAAGGGDPTELPGPLDVQPVIEVEAELGQASARTTRTTRRTTGLLPADLNSPPDAAISSKLEQPGMPLSAPAPSWSPRSRAPLASRYPRSPTDGEKHDEDEATGVVAALGGDEQQTETALHPPSGATTALPEAGAFVGLTAVASRDQHGTESPPLLTMPLSGEPCAESDVDDEARGGREAATDSEVVGASCPARHAQQSRQVERPVGRVSDVDSFYITGGSSTTSATKNNDSNTVASTTAITSPRQQQQQQQQQQPQPAPVFSPHSHQRRKELSRMPSTDLLAGDGNAGNGGRDSLTARGNKPDGVAARSSGRTSARYSDCYPTFAAVLSAHHNGRALTRQADCRSLPLTSRIMSRGRRGRATGGKGSGLTAVEEEACLRWQWKLYSIHVRVIKDYAAVFSYGDGWSVSPSTDDSNSLVYSGDASALHYRVNSKARPEVYNIVTDVLNNRCEQWEELPTGLGLRTTWNLLWTWSKPHIQYSSLLTWQKVNHFPNSRELTRKDLLNKHISRFMAPGGRLAKEFHIMPQTFVLPHEFTLFVSAFTASGRAQRGGRGNVDSTTCRGSSDEEDSEGTSDNDNDWNYGRGRGGSTSRRRSDKGNNLWIMKPVGMSRGRGIRLIDDIKNISYADKVVLQRYVGNPLLLDGYKFDLRLYVLVTSFNKLEAFIYKEGFARLSTHRYEKGDIDNRFIHLTNSSIQRLNETGAAQDSPLHHAKTSEAGGTKTTLSYLWRRLAASGVDVGALWAGICSVVVKSLVCVEGSIPNQPNSFELFGYDVLIDDRLRPWLIEVNSSPSMARDTHVDRQVKEALIFETVHLVDPLPFDRQKLVDVLGRRLSEDEHSKARPFKQHQHQQHHRPHIPPPEACGNAEEGGNHSARGQTPPAAGEQNHRPRRSKEEAELDRDLDGILCGRRPRRVGEPPARMGNFVRLCPGTAAHRHARRLRRRVIRPQPGDDDEPAPKP